ncbi:hypothetical protein J008_05329 [Cryptococcus neoformans]|nr:hypothetical protein J008_05329 [Cryptococcus neoformans var. grubii]
MHSLLFRPLLPLHPHSYVLSVDASIVTSRSSSTSFLLSPSDILPAISPPPLPATDDGISGHIRPLLMPAVNCTSIGPGVPAFPAVPGVGGMRMCGLWYCLILRMILGMGSFSMSVVGQMLIAGAAPRVDYSVFLFLCGSGQSVCAPPHSNLRTALEIYGMETILKPSLAMSSLGFSLGWANEWSLTSRPWTSRAVSLRTQAFLTDSSGTTNVFSPPHVQYVVE